MIGRRCARRMSTPLLPAAPAIAMHARPRTDPADSLFWRAACALPLLGSAVWCSNAAHSLRASAAAEPEAYFRSPATGLLVHHCTWAPAGGAPPRAVIYLLHGIFEHVARYAHVGEAWAAAGFLVHGLDHQGHGRSEGDAGYFPAFAAMAADALHLARVVRPAPEGVPRFLFGHSMGGLLALHVAHAAPAGFFAGLALSAPAIAPDPRTDTPLNRFAAALLGRTLPKLEVARLPLSHLCTDAAVVARYVADPLVFHGALRARVGAEMIKAMPQALALAPALALPLLIVHGEEDRLCDISGSRALLAAYGGGDKALQPFAGLMHELHNEPGAASVGAVAAWVRERL